MSPTSTSASERYQKALSDYQSSDNVSSVLAALESLILDFPIFEDSYEALSVIFYNLKRYDEAIATLKKWLRLNPNSIMAHTNLSRCYVAKGMILDAEHEQAEARRLTWKAELKAKKEKAPLIDSDEQILRFKQVIELDPKDVLGYFSLGKVYFEAGKVRDAIDQLERGLRVDPEHSSSYLLLGQALEKFGDKLKAKEIYRQGIIAADRKGDMMNVKKMQAYLEALQDQSK